MFFSPPSLSGTDQSVVQKVHFSVLTTSVKALARLQPLGFALENQPLACRYVPGSQTTMSKRKATRFLSAGNVLSCSPNAGLRLPLPLSLRLIVGAGCHRGQGEGHVRHRALGSTWKMGVPVPGLAACLHRWDAKVTSR